MRLLGLASVFSLVMRRDERSLDAEVIIAGGGLGGLALCATLRRAGVDTIVLERAPQLRTKSQGTIALWPNGLAALRSMGLADQVSRRGVPMLSTKITQRDIEGRESVRAGVVAGLDAVFIQWAQVQEALSQGVSEDPKAWLTCNSEVRSFKDRGDHVEVQTKGRDGTPGTVLRCSMLIGADGTFSRCRAALNPWRTRLGLDGVQHFGQVNFASIVDMHALCRASHQDTPPWLPAPGEGLLVATELPTPHKAKLNCFLVDCGGGQAFWQIRMSTRTAKQLRAPAQITGGRGGIGVSGVRKCTYRNCGGADKRHAKSVQGGDGILKLRCDSLRAPSGHDGRVTLPSLQIDHDCMQR